MDGNYNLRNPAVKRLMKEAREMKDATELFYAQPLEDNLFEWHFTIRGPADTEFDGGIYHGRIILPPEYPMKPPSIIVLTPNGRFETNKKICLSISGYHPESWQPSWSIRTALLAIVGFMPSHGNGAIGSLDYTADERKQLAKKSGDWSCVTCGNIRHILLPVTEASTADIREAKELANQINFQGEKVKSASISSSGATSDISSPASTVSESASSSALTSIVVPSSALPSPPPPNAWAMYPSANFLRSGATSDQFPHPPPMWPPQTTFPFPMQWRGSWHGYNNPFLPPASAPSQAPADNSLISTMQNLGSSASAANVGLPAVSGADGTTDTVTNVSVQTTTIGPNSPSLLHSMSSSPASSMALPANQILTASSCNAALARDGYRLHTAPVVAETRHSADIVLRPPRLSDRILSVLMVIVGVVLALLVFRRIGMFTAFNLDEEDEF